MKFETTLFAVGRNTGIDVPIEVLEQLGGGRRPLVNVTVNGSHSYRSAIAPMAGRYLIAFSSERRAETGLSGGDAISVEVTLDTAPRTVEVPDDLAAALSAAGLRAAFEARAPSTQKADVTNVTGAKTPETRARRIAAVVEKLS